MSASVARITLDGAVAPIGAPGLVRQALPSPNGKFILVESMHRPFSYLVPYSRFPNRVEIWDLDGRVVREMADVPLAEEVPISFDSTTPGPRSFGWRADAPASIHWTEALDGGDPRSQADLRDQVYLLPEPFQGEAVPIIGLGLRFLDIEWGNDRLALVSERWRKNRKIRTWMVEPGSPDTEPVLLFDRSYEDRYARPRQSDPSVFSLGRARSPHHGRRELDFPVGPRSIPRGEPAFPRQTRFEDERGRASLAIGSSSL